MRAAVFCTALYFIQLFGRQAVKEAMTIVDTTRKVYFNRYLRMRLILKKWKYAEQTVLT